MKLQFPNHWENIKENESFSKISATDWQQWPWQMRLSAQKKEDFEKWVSLSVPEKFFFENRNQSHFNVRATPYYLSLIDSSDEFDPIRRIAIPQVTEQQQTQDFSELDPLGERKNNPVERIIHRYADRVLFLITDICSVYCRYCTRKHFTGQEQFLVGQNDYQEALTYIRKQKGIREVILSGGDPLTLSDEILAGILKDLRQIEHIEIIRIGSRMPVVNPMRITSSLVQVLKKFKPIYLMTHFNHPKELTGEAAAGLELLVDNGVPVFNQMVLLNGVNNHAAVIQGLSRRLLFLRVKPYYMFQCDPSFGSDHLRTSIDESLTIQKELWGHLSGLAMPSLSIDIPSGGGKMTYAPNFENEIRNEYRVFTGFDGVKAVYHNPLKDYHQLPSNLDSYLEEWEELKKAKFSPSLSEKPEKDFEL